MVDGFGKRHTSALPLTTVTLDKPINPTTCSKKTHRLFNDSRSVTFQPTSAKACYRFHDSNLKLYQLFSYKLLVQNKPNTRAHLPGQAMANINPGSPAPLPTSTKLTFLHEDSQCVIYVLQIGGIIASESSMCLSITSFAAVTAVRFIFYKS